MPGVWRGVACLLWLGACGPTSSGSGESDGGGSSGGSATSTTGATTGTPDTTGDTDAGGTATTGSTGGNVTGLATEGEPACPDPFMPVTDPCDGGQAIEQLGPGEPSGLAECPDGSIHSYGVACCGPGDTYPCPGENGSCKEDADCNGGACRAFAAGWCQCLTGYCARDSDCEPDEACVCSGSGVHGSPRCVPANCRTDADCGDRACGLSRNNCGVLGLYCFTDQDLCHGPEDCDPSRTCTYHPDNARWECLAVPPCE